MRPLVVLLSATLLLVLTGCGAAREILGAARAEAVTGGAEVYAREKAASGLLDSAPAAPGRATATEPATAPRTEDEAAAGDRPDGDRKRVYSGYARMLVDAPDETRDRLIEIAEDARGYVESVLDDTVVLRVPAERFSEVFATVTALGEVLHRSVETFDVTEQYQDLSARSHLARRTRERLYALLERTDDAKQRLAILREIRRLSEEIERIALTLEMLDRQVALSRITVQLVPRLPEEQSRRSGIPFDWIADLDPLYPSLSRLKLRVGLTLPDDFAVFDRERSFRAESPQGTRVRIGTTANEPRGDAGFWQAALAYHLRPFYRDLQVVSWGQVAGVLLASKDRTGYGYFVGVVARGRRLLVVEVFFPNVEDQKSHLEPVREAIRVMEVR